MIVRLPPSPALLKLLEGQSEIVEASGFERLAIYREVEKLGVEWREPRTGLGPVQIGSVAGQGVYLCLYEYRIRGRPVLFWEASSQMVYYPIIEELFDDYAPKARRVNAMNFHP